MTGISFVMKKSINHGKIKGLKHVKTVFLSVEKREKNIWKNFEVEKKILNQSSLGLF